MKTWTPLILGLLALAASLIVSCQSVPPDWRIGIRSTIDAAAACIEGDNPAAGRDDRIRTCAAAMLGEAADAVEEIGELPAPEPVTKPSTPPAALPPSSPRAPRPPSTPNNEAAPRVDPPDMSPDMAPGSTAWRAPDRLQPPMRPPAVGWPYRYRRG